MPADKTENLCNALFLKNLQFVFYNRDIIITPTKLGEKKRGYSGFIE